MTNDEFARHLLEHFGAQTAVRVLKRVLPAAEAIACVKAARRQVVEAVLALDDDDPELRRKLQGMIEIVRPDMVADDPDA